MRILQINQTYNIGSTGKIMNDINNVVSNSGNESYMLCAYSNNKVDNLFVSNPGNYWLKIRQNILISRITGKMGYRSHKQTIRMVDWIKSIKPDLIHLHIIHGNWINLELLFKFLRDYNRPVVWTLHDCWAFTGRCSHFENYGCERWKTGCYDCGNNKVFPVTYFFDHSKQMWKDKLDLFTSLPNMTIVTPSEWLAKYVKQSFLGKYPVHVIHNGININNFCIQTAKSSYLKVANGKKIILGVASSWTKWKGIEDIYLLNKMIDKDRFVIALVGLNSRQLKEAPKDIIAIGRTNNIKELAEIYSEAAVFINPTYQDNYPTVNLESIACGTPVITYKTGGSIESVTSSVGCVVEQGDVKGLYDSIIELTEHRNISKEDCRKYALENFDMNIINNKYLDLFKTIIRNE